MKPTHKIKLKHIFLLAVSLTTVLFFISFSQWKPFKPPVPTEIPEGPGLLSGEDGEFVIYRKKSDAPAE